MFASQWASWSAHAQSASSGGVPRDPWRFTSSLGVDEVWSDNITLASRGAERSDFVTTLSPSLRLSRFGPRLTVDFSYTPQYLYYARGTYGSDVRNALAATAKAKLIENLLFFDASVAVAQSNVSPFGQLAANSVSGSNNRAETRTYSLGPSLRSRYGTDLSYSAGYRFTGSTADNSLYAANHNSAAYAQFESGTSFRNFGYGADVSRSRQGYGEAGDIVQDTIGTTLTYVLAPSFHLRGRVGYDRNSYPSLGQSDLKGASYSGGFDWQPSRHTQLNAQIGHRPFGPTANVSLRETLSRFALTASYSRDQTTSAASSLGQVADPNYALFDQNYQSAIPDPALRAQAVAAALQQAGLPTSQFSSTTFLSNQLYLQTSLRLAAVFSGLRNTVSFDVVRGQSQALSNIDTGVDVFDQSQKFRTTSFSANWSHRLGPRTSANVSATKSHSQALVGVGDTRQRLLAASVNRQIGKNLNGSVQYRNTQQTGAASGSLGSTFNSGDYRENAVVGSLRLTF